MKTFAVALILILSCTACENDPVVPVVDRIDFGTGGGFAPNYYLYSLDATGHLTGAYHVPRYPQSDTAFQIVTKTIDPIVAKRLMSRASVLFPYKFSEGGGVSLGYYLTIGSPGGDQWIQWSYDSNGIDKRVVLLYDDLNKLLK